MRLIDRILPKAENFRDFAPPEGELPRRALPFIWIFVKALRWSIGFSAVGFAISSVAFAFEPAVFGKLVDALTHADPAIAWHAAWPILLGYIVICHVVGRGIGRLSQFADGQASYVLLMIVRRRLASYLFSHSYRYFQDDFAGRLAGKVVEMPQSIRYVIGDSVISFLQTGVNALTSVVLFCVLGWKFAAVSVLFFTASLSLYRWRLPILSKAAGKEAAANQVMRGS